MLNILFEEIITLKESFKELSKLGEKSSDSMLMNFLDSSLLASGSFEGFVSYSASPSVNDAEISSVKKRETQQVQDLLRVT